MSKIYDSTIYRRASSDDQQAYEIMFKFNNRKCKIIKFKMTDNFFYQIRNSLRYNFWGMQENVLSYIVCRTEICYILKWNLPISMKIKKYIMYRIRKSIMKTYHIKPYILISFLMYEVTETGFSFLFLIINHTNYRGGGAVEKKYIKQQSSRHWTWHN